MSRDIPMLQLEAQTAALWPELEKAVHDVLRSGRFILGPNVEAFEREAADYLGVRHAVGVSSGSDALILALRALGCGPGDEVIVPSFTFFATAEAVSLVGARPVFAEIDPVTYCLDPDAVEAAIGPRTKAVIPVHLFGHPADMERLQGVADRHGLAVVEDAAQAFGASVAGRKAGALGRVAAFSFFPSKNLGAFGDAGLLTTDDEQLASYAKKLRGHGSVQRYVHETIGYTARLDEIQAAILRVKLPHVDRWNEARRQIASTYNAAFAGLDGLTTPAERAPAHHVYHQYTLRSRERDALMAGLAERGVGSVIYYPEPVHASPPYADCGASLPETDNAAAQVFSLPIWPEMDDASIERVISAMRAALG